MATERERLMAKARRDKYLSPSELAKLTPGQRAKLAKENALPVNNPRPTYGTTVVDGKTYLSSINGQPTFGFGAGGGGGGGGNTDTTPPDFDSYARAYIDRDPFYQKALDSLAKQRVAALNAASEGERSLASDYGLGITQNDSGATFTGQWAASDPGRLGIDPSNPFSRASLLNKAYFVAGKVGEGSYANRGLLTSGAYGRNMQRDAFRNEMNRDQLIKQFGASLQDYRQRRADAETNFTNQSLSARESAQQRAIDDYNRRFAN